MITDLSPAEMAALTCLAAHIEREDLVFASLPGNLLQPDWQYDPHRAVNTWVFHADFGAIRTLMGHFQEGTWPAQ